MAIVSLNTPGGVSPAPDERVLKAADYARFVEADRIIEETRRQSDEILAESRRDAEERLRQGYADGLRQGKDEVAEQLFKVVSASVEQVAGMESTLVNVVMQSLRTILGSFDREEVVAKVVGHALKLVRDEKRVLLRVSPADAPLVEARLGDIMRQYPEIVRVDVQPDRTVADGGCIMETDLGVIDATLERQLSLIEETFRQQLEGGKS